MKITNEFTVHTPLSSAWKVLTDLEGIAPCLPGAQLTGVDGDVYQGKVRIKVGPVISDFSGTARFVAKDDDAHRAVIDAKGRDSRAGGNASALITAQLRPDGDSTVVTVDTDLKISGKLAQFGSGMIKEVSSKLLGQFVEALEAKIGQDGGAGTAAASPVVEEPVAVSETPAAVAEPPAVKPAGAAFETGRPAVPATVATGGPAAGIPALPHNGAAIRTEKELEPLDLMAIAGGSVGKRLIPVAAGVVVVVAAVVIWRLAGR